MSPLEELALALTDHLVDLSCAGPDCALIVEPTEMFCSQACQAAFDVWAEDMRHDADHDLHWTEVAL